MSRRVLRTVMALMVVLFALPAAGQGQQDKLLDSMMPIERQDFGVKPVRELHAGSMHAPTPATIPGGQMVTTRGLVDLVRKRQVPHVILDVLGDAQTLPGAVPAAWMAAPGSFSDATQRRVVQALAELTQGSRDTVLVFHCRSRECWMSYNAALRAIQAGYRNVVRARKAFGAPVAEPAAWCRPRR